MDKIGNGERLYAALVAGDAATLDELLADDFVGDLTPGLPNGYGQALYQGREAMKRDGWGRVGASFAIGPHVEEILDGGDYIIGRGRYVGTAVATGKRVDARFAHFWKVRDGRIAGVVQVTDSAAWEHALEP